MNEAQNRFGDPIKTGKYTKLTKKLVHCFSN